MTPKKFSSVSKICGEVRLPGDKSISHRAIMLGAIATGITVARGVLDCDDCNYTIRAFRDMGVRIVKEGELTSIHGVGLRGLKRAEAPINVGNSGTTMRILPGILAGQSFEVVLTGDEGLMKRPMKRVVEPLSLMGVGITASPEGCPPLKIQGGAVRGIRYDMAISSAQVKSAILFAGLYADGVTIVTEKVKSRDHTERMLAYFGGDLSVDQEEVSVRAVKELGARTLEVPGDISSASFFMVAAIILKNSRVTIRKVSINPTRAGILDILSRMGARVKILNKVDTFEPYADIEVESGLTNGIEILESDIPGIIDELPIIFVLAALSKGRTVIKGAEELKVKETDRIHSMKENLEKMGAKISLKGGSIIIDGVSQLHGSMDLKSYGDHRTCMSMAVAAMDARGESAIDDIECVSKSFPGFFKVLEALKC